MGNSTKKKTGKGDNNKSRALTGKEYSFCVEYVRCGKEPSEAYKNSEYSSDNMSPQVIANKAYKLLQKDYIRVMIEELESEVVEKVKEELEIDLKWTIEKVGKLAQEAKSQGVQLKALDMLIKHFGGYEKDNKQKGDGTAKPVSIMFKDFASKNKKQSE